MASRHQRSTSIGEYIPFHINAAATNAHLPQTGAETLDYGHGVFLGTICINDPGSGCTLTIFNGNGGPAICAIKPSTNVTLDMQCVLDGGLYYTYTVTTPGSITLNVLPVNI